MAPRPKQNRVNHWEIAPIESVAFHFGVTQTLTGPKKLVVRTLVRLLLP